jgi:hypothetical protein
LTPRRGRGGGGMKREVTLKGRREGVRDSINSSVSFNSGGQSQAFSQSESFGRMSESWEGGSMRDSLASVDASPIEEVEGEGEEDEDGEKEGAEVIDLRWEVMQRVLFVYSVVNPGVGYVQGMVRRFSSHRFPLVLLEPCENN